MAFEYEKKQALRILDGIEQGSMSASQSYHLLEEADPTLVYFILTWLREHYHAGHAASDAVIGRVVEICGTYPAVTRLAKEGAADSVVAWFEDAHTYREFGSHEFISTVVEKLEG